MGWLGLGDCDLLSLDRKLRHRLSFGCLDIDIGCLLVAGFYLVDRRPESKVLDKSACMGVDRHAGLFSSRQGGR